VPRSPPRRHKTAGQRPEDGSRTPLVRSQVGAIIYVSGDTLSKVEKAQRYPTQDLAAQCDAALDTGGSLSRLWGLVDAHRGSQLTQTHDTGSAPQPSSRTSEALSSRPASADISDLRTEIASLAEVTTRAQERLHQIATTLNLDPTST
jgi:hypothetical protein